MIYTITFNPALDYKIWINKLKVNNLNRFSNFDLIGAGKGVHQSILLNNLGVKSKVLGFIAGFVGEEISLQMKKYKFITNDFTTTKGNNRINIKINDETTETEFSGVGIKIDSKDLKKLHKKISNTKKDDVVILAGSTPQGLKNIYAKTAKIVSLNKSYLVVDTNNSLLLESLPYKPFIIKPNLLELESIFQKKLNSDPTRFKYMEELKKQGAQNVLLSLGEEGALFLSKDEKKYKLIPPKGKFINSSGAGDSMLAGFMYKYLKTKDYKEALKFAIACGTATCYSKSIASKKLIYNLYEKVSIIEVE